MFERRKSGNDDAPVHTFTTVVSENQAPPAYQEHEFSRFSAVDALRIASIFMLLEAVFRVVSSIELLGSATSKLRILPAFSLLFGLSQFGFALTTLYVTSLVTRCRKILYVYGVSFGILTILLFATVFFSLQTILLRAEAQFHECAINPNRYGLRSTAATTWDSCNQHVLGIKFAAVLLQAIRVLFQLLLILVVRRFVEDMLQLPEQSPQDPEAVYDDSSNSSKLHSVGLDRSHSQAEAPSYEESCQAPERHT